MDWISRLIFDRRKLTIFLSLVLSIWALILILDAHTRRMLMRGHTLTGFWLFIVYFMPSLLFLMELGTVICYLLTFHYLFRELKRLLTHQRYQMIKYKTATYLALISILVSARFFYYGITALTFAIVDSVHFQIRCSDLIPSYLTELAFCIFVIYHVF